MSTFETAQMQALRRTPQGELLAETRAAAKAGAKLIMWSETAAPALDAEKAALLQQVSNLAPEEGVFVNAAIGVPYARNETFLIGPDEGQKRHYRKNHPARAD